MCRKNQRMGREVDAIRYETQTALAPWLCNILFAVCLCGISTNCLPSLQGNAARDAMRQVPPTFVESPDGASAQPLQTTNDAQKTWAEFFSSPELKSLIETALTRNQEYNVRMQEIIIAQTEVSARQGEYWPRVSAAIGGGIDRVGKYTSRGASDDRAGLPPDLGDFSFGLIGSWEVDIWRKLRNARDAADLRYLASIEARNFMVTQLIAEVARSYYDLMVIDNQLDIVKRNVEIQSNALEVVKLEKVSARVTELAVQRFEAEVLKNKSRVYDLEQEKVQTENRINFLVGRYPQKIERNAQDLQKPLPAAVQTGLPAQLLENRPDLRQAEIELAAAKLDVDVAKAAFYPALTLDAGVGYRAFNIKHLVTTPDSLIYNAAGNLVAPLLNRQAITAQYRSANARQLQAVFNYEKTLLQAFTDVVNLAAMINNLQHTYELQAQQVETLARSVEISTVLFQAARADYMEVLLTRRDFLEAEMQLAETKNRQYRALISIYQALGGGWRANPENSTVAH